MSWDDQVVVKVGAALAVNAGITYSPRAKLSGQNAQEQFIGAYETTMSQIAADLGVGWKF